MARHPRGQIASIVLLVLVSALLSPGVRTAPAWTYATSAHFEVYTTGGDSRARDALVYFERAHAFFSSYLQLTPKQARPTRLVIFSNDREYEPYRYNESATAYYQPGPDRDYIVMKSLSPDLLPVVVHEYVHLIIRYSGERFPVWLNEGLAEYFATIAPEGSRMSIGRVQAGRLQYLSSEPNRAMPLDRLFAVTHDSPEYTTKTHSGAFYSESWALVHMLLSDDRYRPKSQHFLASISSGTAPAAALEAVYQLTLPVVFKDLLSYIQREQYRYLVVDYKAPPMDDKAPTRPASAFEAGLVTANLLAANRAHEADARKAFEALAKDQPDDVMLAESRGYLELRHGHMADATPYFARAVELGTTNAGLLRDYAILVGPSDFAKTEALLVKSLSIAPDDLETRMRLANVYLTQRKPDSALATLAPVTHVPPDSASRFFQLLASTSASANRFDEAKAAAARAISTARTDSDSRAAAQLAASIDDFLARRASVSGPSGASGTAPGRMVALPVPSDAPVPPAPPAPKITVAARITNFICNTPAVLEVSTAGGPLRLLVEDLRKVQIESSGGAGSDIVCGAQNTTVRLGYDPGTNTTLKTAGVVRVLDFRR